MERRRPSLGPADQKRASGPIWQVPVPADGKYQVVVYLTKARDYGVVQFSLGRQAVGQADRRLRAGEGRQHRADQPRDGGIEEGQRGAARRRWWGQTRSPRA